MKPFFATIILAAATASFAQPATMPPREPASPETVSVTGTGRVTLVPDRFTFNVGVRWSYFDGFLPEQSGGGGRWSSLTTYPRLDAGYTWNTFAPRTSVVYQLSNDGRNLAKAS